MIGDIKIIIGNEKLFVEDGKLKTEGKIYLSIDGRRNIYNIKSKTDKKLFLKRVQASVLRNGFMNADDKKRLVKKIITLWNSYDQQYNSEKKYTMPKKTALTKITTRAKEIRKKQPAKKWAAAIKQASAEYRQTGLSVKHYDVMRKAKAPGKRKAASGKVYYERRKNRSDVPGTLSGAKSFITGKLKEQLSKYLMRKELADTKRDKKKWSKLAANVKAQIKRYS